MCLIYSQGTYSLSASQNYSSCKSNYSSCSLSYSSSNTTGCGGTKTSTCNGSTITMRSKCTQTYQNERYNCCYSAVLSTYINMFGNNYDYRSVNRDAHECVDLGGTHHCDVYADVDVAYYTTTYSYSSSWTYYTAYYSSSTLTSTSYDYYRTYTANSLVYSQSYTINYTTSQVNPKTSVY